MGGAVGSVRADADGKTFRFALNQPLKMHQSAAGNRAVVDLAPQGFAGAMPDLPQPVVAAPKPVDVGVPARRRACAWAAYANFTRLVFDFGKSVPYTVFPGAGKMTIKFHAAARADLSAMARFPPPWVKNAAWHLDGGDTVVEFETDADSGYHDFTDGTKIVLDVLAPKTDASAYAPPGHRQTTDHRHQARRQRGPGRRHRRHRQAASDRCQDRGRQTGKADAKAARQG